MSDLVTGEAVVLDLRAAKLPSRALAVALDLAVEFAGLLITSLVLSVALSGLDGAALTAILLGLMVFFLVGVPVMVETFSHGRSLGKAALGLRVVRGDGGPVRFRHALVRGLTGFFELITLSGAPAVICSVVNSEGKRLGDIFAGTLVVRERAPGGGGTAVALPPVHPQLLQSMGHELRAMDLSAVPEPLWLAIRQLLGRIGQLDQAVAHQLSARLAADLAARTSHDVPPGVHPAAYLGAVLTERQRREWTRAEGYRPTPAPQAPQTPQAPPTSQGPQTPQPSMPAAAAPLTAPPAPPAPPAPAATTQPNDMGFAPPA
ncbi:RDD family protein [Kitasatospora sp. NPDC059408]|uniref:RDD family protein n=1 Tax=Kitasatospora sp. NPDC059408 TaxID=3346823 RepID=UPI00367524F7